MAAVRPEKLVVLDRALELLPTFRLSDSTDEGAITFAPGPPFPAGSRWRVIPAPDDRVPGTFDQDVYIELVHRYGSLGFPNDGVVSFTLHSFLRSMGRRVDGRTYEQLRSALARFQRTILESTGTYARRGQRPGRPGTAAESSVDRLTLLTAVAIDRRRAIDRDQIGLFAALATGEPGEARVTISPWLRSSLRTGPTTRLSRSLYFSLPSPTARRLYRLIMAVATEAGHAPQLATGPGSAAGDDGPEGEGRGGFVWKVALEALADQLPLSQRYPSHLQRVLEPAHGMLKAAGIVREASIRQLRRAWVVHYELR